MYSDTDNPQAGWVAPFGNPRIKVCLLTPRGLSQATTSFIASYCQGIHRMRLFTYYIVNEGKKKEKKTVAILTIMKMGDLQKINKHSPIFSYAIF